MKKQIKLVMGLTLSAVILLMTLLGCPAASKNEKAKTELSDLADVSDLLGTWQSHPYTESVGDGEFTAYGKVIITKDTYQTVEVVTESTTFITTGEKFGTLFSIAKIDQQDLVATLSIEYKGITDIITITFTDSTKTAFNLQKTYYKVP